MAILLSSLNVYDLISVSLYNTIDTKEDIHSYLLVYNLVCIAEVLLLAQSIITIAK